MPDPANRWRPVTTEYQDELAPPRRSLRDRLFRRRAPQAKAAPAQAKAAVGVLGVMWFYLLNAGAYFVSGSVLLCFPLTNPGYLLTRHAHLLLPFPVRPLEDVPFVNVLAESLFIMAAISAAVAVLWMTRSPGARGLTLLYAGAWLLRNGMYLFGGCFGFRAPILSPAARELLILDAVGQAVVFGYLAFYLRAAREKQKLKA